MYENKPHAPENLSLNGQEKDIHRWMHTHPNTKPPPQQQKKKKGGAEGMSNRFSSSFRKHL